MTILSVLPTYSTAELTKYVKSSGSSSLAQNVPRSYMFSMKGSVANNARRTQNPQKYDLLVVGKSSGE